MTFKTGMELLERVHGNLLKAQNHLGWKDLLRSNPTINLILPSPSLNVSLSAIYTRLLKASRDGDSTKIIGIQKNQKTRKHYIGILSIFKTCNLQNKYWRMDSVFYVQDFFIFWCKSKNGIEAFSFYRQRHNNVQCQKWNFNKLGLEKGEIMQKISNSVTAWLGVFEKKLDTSLNILFLVLPLTYA